LRIEYRLYLSLDDIRFRLQVGEGPQVIQEVFPVVIQVITNTLLEDKNPLVDGVEKLVDELNGLIGVLERKHLSAVLRAPKCKYIL
jgi:hypothetical protein